MPNTSRFPHPESGDSAPSNPAELLRQYGLRPDKNLGQNFLSDPLVLNKIVQAADITPHDTVLEIGPGLGSLTRLLAKHARQVIAVELDGRLLPILRQVLSGQENVHLVQADILRLQPEKILDAPGYKVVANIPYYITSAVIRHLLEAPLQPSRIVLTIQKEVAERICAEPGELSLLAVSVQVYGTPSIVERIPADAFYPPPNVDSAVVRIDLFDTPRFPPSELEHFFTLAKAGFSQKRKNLRNSLSAGLRWEPVQAEAMLLQAGIDPRRRAETLSLDEWGKLARLYAQHQLTGTQNLSNF